MCVEFSGPVRPPMAPLDNLEIGALPQDTTKNHLNTSTNQ